MRLIIYVEKTEGDASFISRGNGYEFKGLIGKSRFVKNSLTWLSMDGRIVIEKRRKPD